MRLLLVLGCAAVLTSSPAMAQSTPSAPVTSGAAVGEEPVDPRAVEALQEMSAFLQSLDTFRVVSTATIDVVTVEDQKVQLDSVSHYEVKKPGIMIDFVSDQKTRQFYYDGKQFTIFAPALGFYSTVPAPPTNREFLDALYERTGIHLPLQDLFRWANLESDSDIAKLQSAFNVGTATIDGAVTDHWAYRTADYDWELWIEQGDQPVPRKLVIIDRQDPTLPAFTARLAWELNPTLDPAAFTFVPSADAIAISMSPPQEVAQ